MERPYKAVVSKVTRATAMIKHAKESMSKHTLKVLYQEVLEHYFWFCCSVWGASGITIRIVTDSPHDAPATPLLRQLRFSSIAGMIRLESKSMVYKAKHAQVSPYLSHHFRSAVPSFHDSFAVAKRMIRNSKSNLRPPRMKTKFGQNSCLYSGLRF